MHQFLRPAFHRWAAAISLLAASTVLLEAQQRDRAVVPDQYKWDLTALYPSDAAWRSAKQKLVAEIPELRQFPGTLASSPQQLADCLVTQSGLQKQLARLDAYAGFSSDQDTRVSAYQGMQQEIVELRARLDAETAFIKPEILKIDTAKLEQFISQEPRLLVYRHYLYDVARRRGHTLSDSEEKLLAASTVMRAGPDSTYSIFSNAEFPYPTVALSGGKGVKIDQAAYSLQRESPSREDRQQVMSAFFTSMGTYRGTFGSLMNSSVQSSLFYARARKYDTVLQAELDKNNIPTSVYSGLIEGIDRNLPTFQRYLKLRKRMMGLKDLHYYDLYAPLVPSVRAEFPVEVAQRDILQALAPLGVEYLSAVQHAFSERWIDLYPTEGKSSGGYENGEAYDVHPYILYNYNGHYDDMSGLAHELGHAMHSYYSNKKQPYPLADYPIFVAEVASTFNENLLLAYMLKNANDDATKLSLLGRDLENYKLTLFRQAQFAEFELRMHEMVEKGEPLTGDNLSKLYLEIVRKYYGHDQGICVVDDYVASEWAYIPHFYNAFYVFQYSTSFTASLALSEKVLSGDSKAATAYLQFISSGGSQYPIELLKAAGVDMTSDEPLELTIKKMNLVMDEMERVLDKSSTKVAQN